jgi:type IV pilus assembly protein PilV
MKMDRQAGFTLLEIMVAVFVLSIGLLGLVHLQVVTLKSTQSADFKTQASILATDMLNRMRANKDSTYGGNYNIALADNSPNVTTIADQDIVEWRNNLQSQLPGGTGAIACPAFVALTTYVCTVTITWTDIQTGTANGVEYNERTTSTLTMDSAI